LNPSNGKCPFCGQKLSTSEFSLDVQERWSKIILIRSFFINFF
jgi:sarcosine oxidase delta subunit